MRTIEELNSRMDEAKTGELAPMTREEQAVFHKYWIRVVRKWNKTHKPVTR